MPRPDHPKQRMAYNCRTDSTVSEKFNALSSILRQQQQTLAEAQQQGFVFIKVDPSLQCLWQGLQVWCSATADGIGRNMQILCIACDDQSSADAPGNFALD